MIRKLLTNKLTARKKSFFMRLIYWSKKIIQTGAISFIWKIWGWRPAVLVFTALLAVEMLERTHEIILMADRG